MDSENKTVKPVEGRFRAGLRAGWQKFGIGGSFWSTRLGHRLVLSLGFFLLLLSSLLTYYSVRFSRMIDQRLTGELFQNTSRIFTAPLRIAPGESYTPRELAKYLERSGYAEDDSGAFGRFRIEGPVVEIWPSPSSYFAESNALRVEFKGPKIALIKAVNTRANLASAELEPQPLTNVFDSSREKRRPVRYKDLPKTLIDAVLAAEDKRFFEHPGFDPIRLVGAAWVDLRLGEKAQGGSTLTMQLARSFFFTSRREWSRKLAETLMALQIEGRFTKEEIFELYANQIYLGNRGTFAIHGFGEAAKSYFGKDLRDLNLAEVSFLAGIIRAPNRYSSAERRPDRVAEARNRVLRLMTENNAITPQAAEAAKNLPLRLLQATSENGAAPCFVDMVKDELLERFSEGELQQESHRIYSTLDPALQRAASEGVEIGMREVDAQLARRAARGRKKGQPPIELPTAEVALVAMDPRTGAIRALIGGRDYGRSQLNRVLASRQPGSVFKPFVFAAAFESGISRTEPVMTPITTVSDEPTTFSFNGKDYAPNNYGQDFYGTVTLRDVLIRSLNVATVKVAESVGYGRVVEVARRMGLNSNIQATPALALGSYEMTPLDVTAGYTAFANGGKRVEPMFIQSVVNSSFAQQNAPQSRAVLDPRVAYLVSHVLQDVINRGTGAAVRSRGFKAHAAGKTGTSHDGWFAGFTQTLVCVVWVGFDDNHELEISGASSALPIWAEFMKRAVALPGYRENKPFKAPAGITLATIDPESLKTSTQWCPESRQEVFIAGTEPVEVCDLHIDPEIHTEPVISKLSPVSWFKRIFGKGNKQKTPDSPYR